MTRIILFFVCFFTSFTIAETKIEQLQSEFKEILNNSISYNNEVLESLRKIKDKESDKKESSSFVSLSKKSAELVNQSLDFTKKLKNEKIIPLDFPDYKNLMSAYRFRLLPQIYQEYEEKYRLDNNCDFHVTLPYIQLIIYTYKKDEFRHEDTIYRLKELKNQAVKESDEILKNLKLITHTESANNQCKKISDLFNQVEHTLMLINMYVYDDPEGSLNELASFMETFLSINESLGDEIDRVTEHNYFNSDELKKFILSIGYPIMHIRLPKEYKPKEAQDKDQILFKGM